MNGKGILKGLRVTAKRFWNTYWDDIVWLVQGKKRYNTVEGIAHRSSKNARSIFTVQYPEEQLLQPEEFRYIPFLVYDEGAEGNPWGNLAGMRVSGEPVAFEAGLRIVHPDWAGFSSAVKYLQRPGYSRTGTQGIVESDIEGMAFKAVVTDTAPAEATLDLVVTVKTNTAMAGVYLCVDLPTRSSPVGCLKSFQREPRPLPA